MRRRDICQELGIEVRDFVELGAWAHKNLYGFPAPVGTDEFGYFIYDESAVEQIRVLLRMRCGGSKRMEVTDYFCGVTCDCDSCGKEAPLTLISIENDEHHKMFEITACKDCCKELAEKILQNLEGKV